MSAIATLPGPATTATPNLRRSAALDRLRGLAVALMVLDHLLMVFAPEAGAPVRNTLTRLAMPLFAVLAGHLARRLSWRLGWVLVLGLLMTSLFPAFGSPSILLQLAWYCGLLVALRRLSVWTGLVGPAWVPGAMVFVSLLAFANGFAQDPPGGYPDLAVCGLVGLGALLSRDQLNREGSLLPAFLEVLGRFPLTLYVGHIVAIWAVASYVA